MTTRQALHMLVDALPENDIPTAARVLQAMSAAPDPVERALAAAPLDDEPDDDDFDGGLTEARQEVGDGKLLSHDEVKRELGLL